MKNKIIFKTLMLKGEAGSTIVSMEKTGHVGTADIYTITFNDGSTTEISLENMSAITSVEKTSSTDTEDIYTITCADGSTQTFSVLNHNADIAAMSEVIENVPFITAEEDADMQLPVQTINDETVSLNSTWSSDKISDFGTWKTVNNNLLGEVWCELPSYATAVFVKVNVVFEPSYRNAIPLLIPIINGDTFPNAAEQGWVNMYGTTNDGYMRVITTNDNGTRKIKLLRVYNGTTDVLETTYWSVYCR